MSDLEIGVEELLLPKISKITLVVLVQVKKLISVAQLKKSR